MLNNALKPRIDSKKVRKKRLWKLVFPISGFVLNQCPIRAVFQISNAVPDFPKCALSDYDL